MTVKLWIENPKGHPTEDTQFLPGTPVRVAGRVTGIFGVPMPLVLVWIWVDDKSLRTTTNPAGNFWWDIYLPLTPGPCLVTVSAGVESALGVKSLALSITRSAVQSSFEMSVDPKEPQVGGSLKITVRAFENIIAIQELSVFLSITNPIGSAEILELKTNSLGIASYTLPVTYEGRYMLSVRAPSISEFASLVVVATLPKEGKDPGTVVPPVEPVTPEKEKGIDPMLLVVGGLVVGVVALGMMKKSVSNPMRWRKRPLR